MPQTTINVYDRNTIQTEKVKGWEMCRVFKGTTLTSEYDTSYISVANETRLIEKFTQDIASNYKGTNTFDLSKLNNFNSFRITAQGVMELDGTAFELAFQLLDDSSTLIEQINPNYSDGHPIANHTGNWVDWYLDIEVTYYRNDANDHSIIINGNYTHSNDFHPEKVNVSLVSICGNIDTSQNNVKFDLFARNTSTFYLKQVNIDFVE